MRARKTAQTPFIITLLLAALFSYSLYQKALFNGGLPNFDESILWAVILSMIFASGFTVYYIRLKEKPAVWPLLMIFLIPLTVMLSYIGAVSRHGALMSLLIHVVYALLFSFGYVTIRNATYRKWAGQIFLYTGYAVVLFGFLNWLGLDLFVDAVGFFSGEYRLMSVFQYANSYGAYLIGLSLSSLFVVTYSGSRKLRFVASFMLPLIFISFVLTLSRGAWLVFPIVFVFVLLFFKLSKQLLFTLHTVVSAISAMLVFSLVSHIGVEQQSAFSIVNLLLGLGLLIFAAVISAALGHVLNRYVEPKLSHLSSIENKRMSWMWLPFGSIGLLGVIGALFLKTDLVRLLPDHIQYRISTINFAQHSVLERFSFYSDAFRLSQDYPIFGAGGGAWRALYEQYQSYPYLSTQVHSFLYQQLVEGGWVGLLAFLGVLIVITLSYIIRTIRSGLDTTTFPYFIWITALLAHSLIDFNLSYVAIGFILYFSLGVLAQHLPNWTLPKEKLVTQGFSFVLVPLIIVVFFISINTLDGHLTYKKTSSQVSSGQLTSEQLTSRLEAMVKKNKNPVYLDFYFQVQLQLFMQTNNPVYLTGLENAVDLMEQVEPERLGTWMTKYHLDWMKGKQDEAIATLQRAVERFPWDLGLHEEAIQRLSAMGSQAQTSYWVDALTIFANMEDKLDELGKMPPYQVQSKPFEVTAQMALAIAQVQFLMEQPNEAYQTIVQYIDANPGFAADDEQALRNYLEI